MQAVPLQQVLQIVVFPPDINICVVHAACAAVNDIVNTMAKIVLIGFRP